MKSFPRLRFLAPAVLRLLMKPLLTCSSFKSTACLWVMYGQRPGSDGKKDHIHEIPWNLDLGQSAITRIMISFKRLIPYKLYRYVTKGLKKTYSSYKWPHIQLIQPSQADLLKVAQYLGRCKYISIPVGWEIRMVIRYAFGNFWYAGLFLFQGFTFEW